MYTVRNHAYRRKTCCSFCDFSVPQEVQPAEVGVQQAGTAWCSRLCTAWYSRLHTCVLQQYQAVPTEYLVQPAIVVGAAAARMGYNWNTYAPTLHSQQALLGQAAVPSSRQQAAPSVHSRLHPSEHGRDQVAMTR